MTGVSVDLVVVDEVVDWTDPDWWLDMPAWVWTFSWYEDSKCCRCGGLRE